VIADARGVAALAGAAARERTASVTEASTSWLSVREAAQLLGRHRTRVYELVRSGDLVADGGLDGEIGGLRIERGSLERWLVAGGTPGGPLTSRNAWAIVGLIGGDDALCERTLGLLPRPEDVSRARARVASQSLLELAPRLRRRAMLCILHVPASVFEQLQREASLLRTGLSAAAAYGWDEIVDLNQQPWALDAYLPLDTVRRLQTGLADNVGRDVSRSDCENAVLLRAVDGLWPFPPNCQLAPQPLAALDLLDYPGEPARTRGREVLRTLALAEPTTVARRSARGRGRLGPIVGSTLALATRPPRPAVKGDPRADTRAAAAHIVGVLWARASQGATVKELRAATGITRERLEAAYEYLLANPPLGLLVQRQRDELFLVSAPEVSASVERDLGNPRPVPLSKAALEVLAIVAYRQPVTRAGIDHIRGTSSDSTLDTLLVRGLVEFDQHHLLVTTRAFLDFAGLRDLADLPPLPDVDAENVSRELLQAS
jgi:segregation and condensation protein B